MRDRAGRQQRFLKLLRARASPATAPRRASRHRSSSAFSASFARSAFIIGVYEDRGRSTREPPADADGGSRAEVRGDLGDRNPLHFDEAFASKTKFGRLVVQGGLTTGLLHALVAMDLPGPGTVFLSQNWKFVAPVFIGDTITAKAEIVSVHATKPVTELRVRVARDGGETVLEGEAWCYTFGPA